MDSRQPEPSIAWCASSQAAWKVLSSFPTCTGLVLSSQNSALPPGRPGNVPTSPQLNEPPRVKLIKWECKGGRDGRTGVRGKEETFIIAEIVMKLDSIA